MGMLSLPSILERVIEPQRGDFSPEHANYVLGLDFSPQEHARFAELSRKAQEGALSLDEQTELDDFLSVNSLLVILQSKARVSLGKKSIGWSDDYEQGDQQSCP
jgi:hypothetical protein